MIKNEKTSSKEPANPVKLYLWKQ